MSSTAPFRQVDQDYEPQVALDRLHEHPQNARRGNVEALDAGMRHHGFYGACYAQRSTGFIVAGNHRYRVARQLGAETLPVIWLDIDDDQAERILEWDNRASDLGDYDPEAHEAHLRRLLEESELGLVGTGYTVEDLAELFGDPDPPEPHTDPNHVPAPPREPRTRSGDVWLLGDHRLICGDCTDPQVHERLLAGESVDLVLTDPPYGVNIDYGVGIGDYEPFEDTPERVAELIEGFMPLALRWPVVLITSGRTMIWHYPKPTWLLAWVVPAGAGRGPWGFNTWQPVLAYGKDPYLARGMGGRPDSVTMLATRDPDLEGHPVIKPMEVWKWLMERGAPEKGAVVLDPFCGSGTTIIAAYHLGRRALGIELSPSYVDVACRRWQEHTGVLPVLESTGEAHDFTAEAADGEAA